MSEPELLEGEAYPGEFARRREFEHQKWIEKENLKTTLHGVRSLILHALEGETPDFLKAKRLCDVAEQLRRALGTRVGDFGGQQLAGEPDFACQVDDAEPGLRRMGAGVGRIGGGMEDLTRMLLGLLEHQTGTRSVADGAATKASDARVRETEALELESLVKLVGMMPDGDARTRIQKRIDTITKNMEETTDGLVHPDVLGGRQALREGGEDAGAADGDDDRRARRAQGDPPAREPDA